MITQAQFRTTLISVLIVGVGLLGCQGERDDDDTTSRADESSNVSDSSVGSPEIVFKAAQQAIADGDCSAFVECLTEDSQTALAGMLVQTQLLCTSFPAEGDAAEPLPHGATLVQLDQLLADYGIDTSRAHEWNTPEESTLLQLGRLIDDRPAFLRDALTTIAVTSDDSPTTPDPKTYRLQKLTVDGDTASAIIVAENDVAAHTPPNLSEPITFRYTPSGWRIQIPLIPHASPTGLTSEKEAAFSDGEMELGVSEVAADDISDPDETITLCTESLEADASDAESFATRAEAFFRIGRWNRAVADSICAIRRNPEHARAYRLRSFAASKLAGGCRSDSLGMTLLLRDVGGLLRLRAELLTAMAKADLAKANELEILLRTVAEIEAWSVGGVDWLGLFGGISAKMPPADEMLFVRADVTSSVAGARVRLDGLAAKSAAITKLQDAMPALGLTVEESIVRESPVKETPLSFKFEVTLLAPKRALGETEALAAERLVAFERRALPPDPSKARSLYQAILLDMLETAKLKKSTVDPQPALARRRMYAILPYRVAARGTLAQLAQLLAAFQSTARLHRLTLCSVSSLQGTDDLEFNMSIEALSLPNAVFENQPPAPRETSLEAVQPIIERNPFLPVRDDDAAPPFDPLRFAVVSGISTAAGAPQAWISVRTTGENLRLSVGDTFTVGETKGKVTRIGDKDVELELDGSVRVVLLGSSLAEGIDPSSSPE